MEEKRGKLAVVARLCIDTKVGVLADGATREGDIIAGHGPSERRPPAQAGRGKVSVR